MDALEAELLACMEGLNLAVQWTTLPIEVEMDCLVGQTMIIRPDRDRSTHAMVVDQIRRLLQGRETKISHIAREQNVVSHFLPNFGRVEAVVWLGSGPVPLSLNRYSLLPAKKKIAYIYN